MYNSQEIANRIKTLSKQKNISVNQLLLECGLGKNTVAKLSSGTDILTQNFAKIADYLNCSVDYLLGRTDYPDIITKDNKGNIVLLELMKQNKPNDPGYRIVAFGGDNEDDQLPIPEQTT